MRITYHSTDVVNRDLVTRLAHECGATVSLAGTGDTSPSRLIWAAIYDLDHLHQQQMVLEDLLSRPSRVPVAVHGYCLEEEQVWLLDARGVIVTRQIEPELVRRLCSAAPSRQAALATDDGDDEEGVAADPAQ